VSSIIGLFQNKTKNPSKSGFVLLVFRLLSSLLQFPAIVLLTRAWSSEQMGVWLLVSSLGQVILTVADFGLGQSLRLAFAKSRQLSETVDGEKTINSALSVSLIICSIFFTLFFVAFLIFAPQNLFVITNSLLKAEVNVIFIVFIGLNIISVPSMIIIQLYFAFHEPEKTVMYDFIRAIVLFILAILATTDNFILIFLLIPALSVFTRFIQTINFYKTRGWIFSFISTKKALTIIRPYLAKSLEFWMLATLAVIQVALLPWLIAKVASVSQLGEFSLLIQIVGFLLALHLSFFMPLQSIYSSATLEKAKNHFTRSLKISVLAMPIIFIVILLFLPVLVNLIGKNINFDTVTLVFFGIWSFCWTVINTISIMLNGFGKIKIQIIGLVVSVITPYVALSAGWVRNLDVLFQLIISGVSIIIILNALAAIRILRT
jgi:O-antigen/teichoic acid export membrane protein